MQTAGFNTRGFRTYSRTSPNTSAQISPELENKREDTPSITNTHTETERQRDRETERERERERCLATVNNRFFASAILLLKENINFIIVKEKINGTILQMSE
jgi:hypothetical protein